MVWKSTTRTCKQGNKGVRGEGCVYIRCVTVTSNHSVCTCVLIVLPRLPRVHHENHMKKKNRIYEKESEGMLLPLAVLPCPHTPYPPTAPVVSLPALPTQSPEI